MSSSSQRTSQLNRRRFIKNSAATVAAASVAESVSAHRINRTAGERIRIGFIGPGGRGFGAHVKTLCRLHEEGRKIDLVAVSDVYSEHRDRAADYIQQKTGSVVRKFIDYRDMLSEMNLDAVCVATPDHWHARQTIDAMKAGLHVYCEKPMTHSVQEALDVVTAWRETGQIMQVGVQSTSLPLWDTVRGHLQSGKLGKVLMFQTEFFRNSAMGQWRYYKLTKQMTPKTIDWDRWLGVSEGLAPQMPFDREIYAQWRRFWPFGSGMYTDLFVHRTTSMLKATGLRFPGRVVGAGGIFLEYDGRDVPDVATVCADYREGVQGLISATMCCQNTPIRQLIRGHFGSFVFGNGEKFTGFDYLPERPQVTGDRSLKEERIEAGEPVDTTNLHFNNFLDAIEAGDQQLCNNPPDLGAAAIVTVNLGSRSYREGKVFHFDDQKMEVLDGDRSWASHWEKMSKERAQPHHIAGWKAGQYGSGLREPDYMSLGGPWKNGQPPTAG